MSQIIPEIDHVIITVSEKLDQAKDKYEKLGFSMTKRGHHSLGTSNNLSIFGSTYLELLGYEPQNANKIDSSWQFEDGLTGLVFKTQNANKLYQSLISRNVKMEGSGPKSFFRPVELDDGSTSEARFCIVRFDPIYTPNGQIFFCDQLTPELVWRAEWQQHKNSVTNINRIVIESKTPEKSIHLLKEAFSSEYISEINGGLRFNANGKFIDYISPEESKNQFGNLLPESSNAEDRKVALTLETKSLQQVENILTQNEIPFIEKNNHLFISSNETFGVVIEFIEAK